MSFTNGWTEAQDACFAKHGDRHNWQQLWGVGEFRCTRCGARPSREIAPGVFVVREMKVRPAEPAK